MELASLPERLNKPSVIVASLPNLISSGRGSFLIFTPLDFCIANHLNWQLIVIQLEHIKPLITTNYVKIHQRKSQNQVIDVGILVKEAIENRSKKRMKRH
jgi:hypothetical protein